MLKVGYRIEPVRNQSTRFWIKGKRINSRQAQARGQCDDDIAIRKGHGVRTNNKAAIALSSERRQDTLDFVRVTYSKRHQLNLERRAHGFNRFEEPDKNRYLGLHHEPDAFNIGRNLLKKLQPFSANRAVPVGEACEVTIRARFVVNVTAADRIAHAYENNRCGADFRPNNGRHEVGVGDQHVRCETRQLSKGGAYPVSVRCRKANIDVDIAPIVPTQLLEFLSKRRYLGLSRKIGLGIPHQHTDAPHPIGLLRASRKRPSGRCAAEHNELAPPHSITSSASYFSL